MAAANGKWTETVGRMEYGAYCVACLHCELLLLYMKSFFRHSLVRAGNWSLLRSTLAL